MIMNTIFLNGESSNLTPRQSEYSIFFVSYIVNQIYALVNVRIGKKWDGILLKLVYQNLDNPFIRELKRIC